jgi:chemotaxis protein MotB
MRLLPPLGVALLAVLLAGCTAGGSIGNGNSMGVDSLRAENARLRAQNRALRDSLQFRQDLETGQYYRERRTLQDRLNRLTYEVRLLRSGGTTVAHLPADSLFAAPDSLSDAGVHRLRRIAQQLRTTYPNRTVRVEGHADSSPLGRKLKDRFGSNWGLSCARATTVTQRLIGLSDLEPGQFVALGYGATQPRYANDTATGRRRNRRVRIAVLPPPHDYSRPFELSW